MKKTLALTLVLAVSLCVASVASARPSPQHKKVARLSREVRALRHRLRNMTIAREQTQASLAQAQAELADSQAQVASLRGQIIDLHNVLAQRTVERDAARSAAASLQAKLNAIPTPMAVAEQQVSRDIWWLQHANLPSTYSHDDFVALSVMNYVESHVSITAFTYLLENHLPLPAVTPDAILAAQAGQCGHHAVVFSALMQHFGYPVRRANFYWTNGNGQQGHTANEVFYGGGWHYFDSYYGLYWTDADGHVMSITDVRANGGTIHQDMSVLNLSLDPWYAGDNDAWFEIDPATTVAFSATS